MKIAKKRRVSPDKLYPLVSFSDILPKTLKSTIEFMKAGKKIKPIKILQYEGQMFILEGNYEMLAANILKWPKVEVDIVDRASLSIWSDERDLLKNLNSISISTLYDFEEVGGFRYEVYPPYYRR